MQKRAEFETSDDFRDFLKWLVNIRRHLVSSSEDVDAFIKGIMIGDDEGMTHSLYDALLNLKDEGKAEGIIESAIRMLKKGLDFNFVVETLGLGENEKSLVSEKAKELGTYIEGAV